LRSGPGCLAGGSCRASGGSDHSILFLSGGLRPTTAAIPSSSPRMPYDSGGAREVWFEAGVPLLVTFLARRSAALFPATLVRPGSHWAVMVLLFNAFRALQALMVAMAASLPGPGLRFATLVMAAWLSVKIHTCLWFGSSAWGVLLLP